jgi:hypothetical protein
LDDDNVGDLIKLDVVVVYIARPLFHIGWKTCVFPSPVSKLIMNEN